MGSKSDIQWTDATWTAIRARVKDDAREIASARKYQHLLPMVRPGAVGPHCERCSPGCENCYSETNNGRCLPHNGTGLPFTRLARDLIDIFVDENILTQPLHWKKPRRIFVCSQTDLFGEFVPYDFIDRVFDVMWKCPQHQFQVLTKRPERMVNYIRERSARQCFGWTDKQRHPMQPGYVTHYETLVMRNECGYVGDSGEDSEWVCDHPDNEERGCDNSCDVRICPIASVIDERKRLKEIGVDKDYEFDSEGFAEDSQWLELHSRPRNALPANVWFGFSAENQEQYEKRMRAFRPMRWISPYLTLFCSMEPSLGPIETRIKYWDENEGDGPNWNSLELYDFSDGGGPLHVPYLNWVIVGGESGPGSRPCNVDWIRSIVSQCQSAGVPVFVKQLGGNVVGRFDDNHGTTTGRIHLDDRKGGDPSEWPDGLDVRQFPEVSHA